MATQTLAARVDSVGTTGDTSRRITGSRRRARRCRFRNSAMRCALSFLPSATKCARGSRDVDDARSWSRLESCTRTSCLVLTLIQEGGSACNGPPPPARALTRRGLYTPRVRIRSRLAAPLPARRRPGRPPRPGPRADAGIGARLPPRRRLQARDLRSVGRLLQEGRGQQQVREDRRGRQDQPGAHDVLRAGLVARQPRRRSIAIAKSRAASRIRRD